MFGLIDRNNVRNLPLRSSSINVEIKGFTARTTAVLAYYNDNRNEIEGLFILPLDHTTAIVEFEAIIEDHYIYTDVKDFKDINEKRILHETKTKEGHFQISVGKISPWVITEIQITVICEITAMCFGDALRYVLPQTFSPKIIEHHEKTIEKISTSTLRYSFNIEIKIEAPCLLYGVQSNTHPIQVDASPLSETGTKLVVTLPDHFEPRDEVFELIMFLCRPREPYIVIEEARKEIQEQEINPINSIMNNPILMLSYSPDFSKFQYDLYDGTYSGEFYLIIDCNTLERTDILETSLLFLKSIPSNSRFNVISFQSGYQSAFASMEDYTSATLDKAVRFVEGLKPPESHKAAQLDLLLKWLLEKDSSTHVPKQLFIITIAASIQSLSKFSSFMINKLHSSRCFIFDIKEQNGRCFELERLAVATRGRYCIVNGNELQKQVMSCLKAAIQPVITSVNVSWILPEAYDVIYTPEKLPSVFFGERLNLYAILTSKGKNKNKEKPLESSASIREFWFEDTEPFSVDKKRPDIYKHEMKDQIEAQIESDHESEVFLTDEEATRLSSQIYWPIDRVRKWRVSKHPQNIEIEMDLLKDYETLSNKLEESHEKMWYNSHTSIRKKNSLDGAESVDSTNSYGSNQSSSSQLYAFPGFPTRMSSCRSIETRSPHFQRYHEDFFNINEHINVKEKGFPDRGSRCSSTESDMIDNDSHCRIKNKMKLQDSHHLITKALMGDHLNTHHVNSTNKHALEELLVSAIVEKRNELRDWVNLQEEMTQCLWPSNKFENVKSYDLDKEWRDSGLGNRSSSDTQTTEVGNDEIVLEKSDSTHLNISAQTKKVYIDSPNCSQDVQTKPKSKYQPAQQRRKSKAKAVWTSLVDKMRNVSSLVSEKSTKTQRKTKIENLSRHNMNGKYYTNTTTKIPQENIRRDMENQKDSRNERVENNPLIIESSRTVNTTRTYEIGKSEIGDVDNLHLLPSQALIYLSGHCGTQLFRRIIPFQIETNNSCGDDNSDITIHQLAAKSIIHDLEVQMKNKTTLEEEGELYIIHLISEVSKTAKVLSKHTVFVAVDDKLNEDEILSTLHYTNHDTDWNNKEKMKSPFQLNSQQLKKTPEDLINQCNPKDNKSYEIIKSSVEIGHTKAQFTRLYLNLPHLEIATNMNANFDITNFPTHIQLLHLMEADGSWKLTKEFALTLSLDLGVLEKSCPLSVKLSEDKSRKDNYANIWATSLAVSWVQITNTNEMTEKWGLVEMKALKWLSRQVFPKCYIARDILIISKKTLKFLGVNSLEMK